LKDFEAGFVQNLMGNVLTFQDIIAKMNEAKANDD